MSAHQSPKGRGDITERDIIDAILPSTLPPGLERIWRTREDYARWLAENGKTRRHIGVGLPLAEAYIQHACYLGMSLGDARQMLLEDPERVMMVTRLPITFQPKYRMGLLDAGAQIWDDMTRAGVSDSFRQVNVNRGILEYATVKVYSKTRANGTIAAGSGLEEEGAYGFFGWARDAGLVCDVGLDLAFAGEPNPILIDVVERQISFFNENQEADGRWAQRYSIRVTPFDTEEEQRAKANLWADPQKDGTAAVMSALAKYVRLMTAGGERAVRMDLVRGSCIALAKGAGYLTRESTMTWDLWEERWDRFFHTDAHIVKALDDTLSVAPIMLKDVILIDTDKIRQKRDGVFAGLDDYLRITDDDRREIERFLGRPVRRDEIWIKAAKSAPGWMHKGDQDHGPINSSAIEAVVETDVLPLDSPSVLSHILLMDEFSWKLSPREGVHTQRSPMWVRFPGDIFDPENFPPQRWVTSGHYWSISTMWAAQHAYRLADEYLRRGEIRLEHTRQVDYINRALEVVDRAPVEKPSADEEGRLSQPIVISRSRDKPLFEAIVSGIWGWGDERFREITRRFNPTPLFAPQIQEDLADRRIPEQYSLETGEPRGERSLTWAYREFIKTVEYRRGLYRNWMQEIQGT